MAEKKSEKIKNTMQENPSNEPDFLTGIMIRENWREKPNRFPIKITSSNEPDIELHSAVPNLCLVGLFCIIWLLNVCRKNVKLWTKHSFIDQRSMSDWKQALELCFQSTVYYVQSTWTKTLFYTCLFSLFMIQDDI